jgi:hypothetical protein
MIAASTALNASCARHQPISTMVTVVAVAIISSAMAPQITPPISQGLRMPNRDVVRSLKRPNNGLPSSAKNAPKPNTSDRLDAALSGASCRTFKAMVTSTGVSNASHVPV